MKRAIALILVSLALTGCGRGVIVEEKTIEVKVPVHAPCRHGEEPLPPVSLSERLAGDDWRSLTTDQREHLLVAQALLRKVYGDKLRVNTAGCD